MHSCFSGAFGAHLTPGVRWGAALGALSGFAPVCSQFDSCAGGVASPRHCWCCESWSQQKTLRRMPWHPARGESAPSKPPVLRRAKVERRFSLYTRRVCSAQSGWKRRQRGWCAEGSGGHGVGWDCTEPARPALAPPLVATCCPAPGSLCAFWGWFWGCRWG